MEFINTKNSDVSDLFKDLNLPQNPSKDKRLEIEDYYVEVSSLSTYYVIDLCSFIVALEIQTIHIE